MKPELIESEEFPGYYVIPGFRNFAINKTGEVIQLTDTVKSSRRKGVPIVSTELNTLVRINIKDDNGKFSYQCIVTLLCLVFIGPRPGQHYIAAKINDKLKGHTFDNVHWVKQTKCSKSFNFTAGSLNGSYGRVYGYHITSGVVSIFNSKHSLCKHCKINAKKLDKVLKSEIPILEDRYLFSENKNADWLALVNAYKNSKPKIPEFFKLEDYP